MKETIHISAIYELLILIFRYIVKNIQLLKPQAKYSRITNLFFDPGITTIFFIYLHVEYETLYYTTSNDVFALFRENLITSLDVSVRTYDK